MRKLVVARRISQTFFLCAFVYILWATNYPLKSLLPPDTFFKMNPLIMIFTSMSERIILPGIVFALAMLLLTLIFGRFFCGWVCPLGTAIDAAGKIRKKGGTIAAGFRRVKFFIFGAIFVFAALGYQIAWILDPMVIMARFVSLNFIPAFTYLVKQVFIFAVKATDFYGPLYDFYQALKNSILGVHTYYFANAMVIFSFFAAICLTTLFVSRFWCRNLCPLGALYSLIARFSLVRRIVDKCVTCRACVTRCRMGAIKDNGVDYYKGECILCMDCVYDCSDGATRFGVRRKKDAALAGGAEGKAGISRRSFLFVLFSSFLLTGFRLSKRGEVSGKCGDVIRPPAALREDIFQNHCVRCGNCMKVCPTNGLQPTMLEAGAHSLWTPHLVPEVGWCEYNCNLCGKVCPTGAIPRLDLVDKKKMKLGVAQIDRSKCIAWANNQNCIVCEEHCPIPDKAIKLKIEVVNGVKIKKPYVDPTLCIGCGICQNKCPVRPVRAITVDPRGADRLEEAAI